MSNLLFDMEKDSVVAPTKDQLSTLSDLASVQVNLETSIFELEKKLSELKSQLKSVSEVSIPDYMQECGISEFKLTDGHKITVKPFYQGSISPENSEHAFEWLRKNNHDDLIKNNVSLTFGKGEDNLAEDLLIILGNLGYSPDHKKTVHPQTLKAFIREQVESGVDFPMPLFNAYIGRKATIK